MAIYNEIRAFLFTSTRFLLLGIVLVILLLLIL